MDEWKYNTWLFQQEMFRVLGSRKWDDLNGEKSNLLNKLNAAFGVCFGPDYREKEKIKKIEEHVIEEAVKLFDEKKFSENFSSTFINWKNIDDDNAGMYLVIWLQDSKGSEICLDLNGRTYVSWDDFLVNNVLPKCYIMYPKQGRYSNGCLTEEFIDIEFQQSIACGTRAAVKTTLDIVTTIGGGIAAGLLIFNPVSASVLIGAAVVSVAAGGYGVGNSICRLYDIHKHDGGLSVNSKTLIAAGELIVSAAGTVAVGAAAGAKALSATGTALAEGSLAYRLANSVSQIAKIFSGVNAGFHILVVIEKYNREGELNNKDLRNLIVIIFFSFNVIASVPLLRSAVKYLAESFSVDRIIDYCIRSNNITFSTVKCVTKFIKESDLPELIEKIFPQFKVYIHKISNIVPIIQRTSAIVDRTVSELSNKFDLNYIYFLQKELLFLWNDVSHYKNDSVKAIQKKFGNKTAESINNWTQNDAIDLPKCLKSVEKIESKFDNKVNTPVEMMKRVTETIQTRFGHIDSDNELKERANNLYSELLELIKLHELRDNVYVLNKVTFYCSFFNSLFSKLLDLYHYEYFLFKVSKGENCSKGDFFTDFYKIRNIHENCYKTAIKLLKDNIKKFHGEFEMKYDSTDEQKNDRKVFEIDMPCYSSELTEDDFYEKARELIPFLDTKLSNNSTTFESFDGVSIIKSNENDFTLFFYTVIENNRAKGILLLVEGIAV